jgi:hypothetical protein
MGGYEGQVGDPKMFKDSGLQECSVGNCFNEQGEELYVYGDKAFYMEQGVIGAYRARRNRPINRDESIYNAYMAKQWMPIEWGFGKVMQYFAFCGYKMAMKVGLSPVNVYYVSSVLLANCHTYYYHSETSMAFQCSAPTIREYFDVQEPEDLFHN